LDDAVHAFRRLLSIQMTADETRRAAETQLAGLYLRLHKYEDAEELVESAIREQSPTRSTLLTAAVVLGACTRLERSLELLDKITANNGHDAAAVEKKAWVLWLLHRYDEAAAAARDALEIMPDNELCLRRLVEYETLGGNPRRAEFYRRRLEAVGQ
jgi:tetratricopeptide (TPR) repeat protein